jgi:uncharacterized membrane protein YjfL (UPF0719 family)
MTMIWNSVICLSSILVILVKASSLEVRGTAYYVIGYELLAAIWLAGAWRLFPFFGISPRDDVVERRNAGASYAVNGALMGVAACFAGANVGNGPGPEAVVFCAAMGSLTFFLVWFVIDLAGSRWSDQVTIGRDHGSGLRLGCLLVATGLTFGSAETGDWASANGAVRDFLTRSWPIVPVLCLALFTERSLRRSSGLYRSWLAAAVYLSLSITCIAFERGTR